MGRSVAGHPPQRVNDHDQKDAMARHAAPRSPWFRRLLLGGAAVVAVTATGVLVAPDPAHLFHLASPPVVTSTAGPTLADPAASWAAQDAARATEASKSAEVRASAEASKAAATERARTTTAAPTPSAIPTRSSERPSPSAPKPTTPAPEPTTPAPAPTPSTAPTTAARAVPASSGSYQDYALQLLGGDAAEMSCLEKLWGKESGWDPTAQNPGSTAYGIPQLLDSTWAATGIAKTSDGRLQIKAGLIYIQARYGSACGAGAHSQSLGWY